MGRRLALANPDWVVINADGKGIISAAPGDFAVPAGNANRHVVPYCGGLQCDGLICPDTYSTSERRWHVYTDLWYGNNPTWALSHQPFVSLASPRCDGLCSCSMRRDRGF